MANPLRIAVWNANGLSKHTQELTQFLHTSNIDILLISETHFTHRSYIKIPNYIVHNTLHPDNTAHGGTAVIIRRNIKHHAREEHRQEHIQATTIAIQDDVGELNITAAYSPPKHAIKEADYSRFFNTLGNRFLVGGDYNAKHVLGALEPQQPKERSYTNQCISTTSNIYRRGNLHIGPATCTDFLIS